MHVCGLFIIVQRDKYLMAAFLNVGKQAYTWSCSRALCVVDCVDFMIFSTLFVNGAVWLYI